MKAPTGDPRTGFDLLLRACDLDVWSACVFASNAVRVETTIEAALQQKKLDLLRRVLDAPTADATDRSFARMFLPCPDPRLVGCPTE